MNPTPTLPRSAVRLRPYARVLLAVAAATALASCSSSPDGSASDDKAASKSAPPKASRTPTTPKASPTPSLPDPADGTKTQACADGTCEIRVTGPVKVPLPARSGVGPLQVTGIDAKTVTIIAPLLQSHFESDGGCSGIITGPGANTSGRVDMTCHAGEKAAVNKVDLEVVGIVDKAAVIRIRTVK